MDSRNDLTQGPIIKKLLLFFLPIAAGTLFQQLYNAVDALVVGRYVGTAALAAVGGSPAIMTNLIIGFCASLAGGAAVVIAQLYGAKSFQSAEAAVQTSYLFCALMGLAVSAVVIVFSPQLLRLLRTPEETVEAALRYQRIYFIGAVFILLYDMGSGILRAVGNSRFPFVCLCVSCLTNIALDLVFVLALDMGVTGAAAATVIAQAISALMVTLRLLGTGEKFRLRLDRLLWDSRLLKQMLHIGVPSGLQASMYGISNTILQVSINSLGTLVVASWAMGGRIDGVYWAISGAFGTAVTTFIGQNYGAGNMERVRESTKKSLTFFLILTVCMSGLILLAGRPLLKLFTNDPGVVETSWSIMLWFVPVYATWSLIEIYSGVLRGMGDTLIPFLITGAGICVFRVLWVLILFRAFPTLPVICLCYPASWIVTDVAIVIYYKKYSFIAKHGTPRGPEPDARS